MNKKIIYLSVFLILALFLISACKPVGERIINKEDNNPDVGVGQIQNTPDINAKKYTIDWIKNTFGRDTLQFSYGCGTGVDKSYGEGACADRIDDCASMGGTAVLTERK